MKDGKYTLLDTPGHVDFSAEMERTLQVLDYAVLVISGADGVQGHTQTLWPLLSRYKVPTFIFINKMDQNGTDQEALMAEISVWEIIVLIFQKNQINAMRTWLCVMKRCWNPIWRKEQ